MRIKSIRILILLLSLIFAAFAQIQFSGIDLGKTKAQEPVSIVISRDTTISKDSLAIALTLRMGKHFHIYAAESLFFKIGVSTKEGLGEAAIVLPQSKPFVNFDKSVVAVFVDDQKIIVKCPILSPQWSLSGFVRSQACDSLMCFTPRTIEFSASSKGELFAGPAGSNVNAPLAPIGADSASVDVHTLLNGFRVVGSTGGFLNAAQFSEFLKDPAAKNNGKNDGFQNKTLLLVIILILLGGIALNLTPCVLPMMPITIAIIGAGSQAKSPGKGMLVGAVYGLSMALTYGILGLIVVLTGTQFGAINSSPIFNLAIAIIFIFMALAMFDIIQVDFTRFRKAGAPSSQRGKLLFAFIMGVVASLLAGACVAPVVISVVIYAATLYASGNTIGLFLPLLLGIGMALPWPFAGAGLALLPKPGKWMLWVKYCFGVFIIGMAVYYGYLGVHLASKRNISVSAMSSNKEITSEMPWIYSLSEGLHKAETENKQVFIDFWATWCKNCTAMDAITFRNPGIQRLMSRYVLVKFQAEKPEDPETKRILNRFNIIGLPTYVILSPK